MRRPECPTGTEGRDGAAAGGAAVCERLGVTHVVDDRLDVLAYLETVEHRYLFLGGTDERPTTQAVPPWATVVESWPQLAALLPPAATG